MEFHDVFNELMTARNLSNYQLSKDTGISDSLIGYWRNGKRKPTLENLRILSQYFNISTDFLITGEESTKQIRDIGSMLSDDENTLLKYYNSLDPTGKHELLEYAQFKMVQQSKNSENNLTSKKEKSKLQERYSSLDQESSRDIIA